MSAAYDKFDYPSFWKGRDYEHEAESIALEYFLNKITKIKKLLDVGAGYGRLTPNYLYRAEKVILSDPSAKLLKIARKNYKKNKKIRFVHSRLENLPKKLKNKTIDAIIMVRVLHHIKNLNQAFYILNRLLKENGYLILEFANKRHLKATITQVVKGDIIFPFDIFPKDKSKKSQKCLPFKNYHPDYIEYLLYKNGFEILEIRSVSNTRSSFLKRHIPLETLLSIEKYVQKVFSKFGMGPSIFVLAKKTRHVKR